MASINLGIAGLDVVEQIGRGGTSLVYRAHQRDLDREVAVKVMSVGDDPDVRTRFDRERRAMGRLSLHEGIVPVYSSGVTERGEPYLVMPYYPDGSLADRMASGPLHWREAVDHLIEVARTMTAAHEANVVHLDLKPGNILLSSDGAPRISDFGIAKLIGDQTGSRSSGASFTPAYSAPETLMGGEVSATADVYGLGATLWALLAGQPPFRSSGGENSLMAVIGRVVHEPPGDLRADAPEQICAVIETAMAKDPVDRHPTAGAFSRALVAARRAADRAAGVRPNRLGPIVPAVDGGEPEADPIGDGAEAAGIRRPLITPTPEPAQADRPPLVTLAAGPGPSSADADTAGPDAGLEAAFGEPMPPQFHPAVAPSMVDDALHRYGRVAVFACSVLVFLGVVTYVAGSQRGVTGDGPPTSSVRSVTESEEAEAVSELQGRDTLGYDADDDPSGPVTSDPSAVSGTGSTPSAGRGDDDDTTPEAVPEPRPGAGAPVTTAPVTGPEPDPDPTTVAPTTPAPTTRPPATTPAPTTAPPTTRPPSSAPPSTAPPSTPPPSTTPPSTTPTITTPPSSEPPTTLTSTTATPTTPAPTTGTSGTGGGGASSSSLVEAVQIAGAGARSF